MKLHALALCLLAAVAPVHAKETASDAKADSRTQIQQVVEQFKAAIKAHDGEGIRKLFLPGGSWQGLDEASWSKVKAKKPEAQQFMPGDYQKFSQFVAVATKPVEETFDHVRIETDGTNRIAEPEPLVNRACLLRLRDGRPLRVSRTYIDRLNAALAGR